MLFVDQNNQQRVIRKQKNHLGVNYKMPEPAAQHKSGRQPQLSEGELIRTFLTEVTFKGCRPGLDLETVWTL